MTYDTITRSIASIGEPIRLPYALADDQKAMLMKAYPEYSLHFRNKPSHHPHPMAATTRILESQILLKLVGYDPNEKPCGYDAVVADIGGSLTHHFQRGRLNVHICSPILDARDSLSERLTTSTMDIACRRSYTKLQAEYLCKLLSNNRIRALCKMVKTAI